MRSVWIEIIGENSQSISKIGHAPCGACGLKSETPPLPWYRSVGHAPCGACGLKWDGFGEKGTDAGHAPCGACGLKYKHVPNRLGIPPVTLHAERVD